LVGSSKQEPEEVQLDLKQHRAILEELDLPFAEKVAEELDQMEPKVQHLTKVELLL
jgi:hypothetical protein